MKVKKKRTNKHKKHVRIEIKFTTFSGWHCNWLSALDDIFCENNF